MKTMRIGELARAAGTQVETVRYYEQLGLLPGAARSAGNYRLYDGEHLRRLSFIRHCRALDMSLDEIGALLRFKDTPSEDCAGVDRLLERHIGHVDARIRELQELQRQLHMLRGACREPNLARRCGILAALSARTSTETGPRPPRKNHVSRVHRSTGKH